MVVHVMASRYVAHDEVRTMGRYSRFRLQEIHQKILSIGFQDCKVFIHSVDAQASANNGIIIQVIGEMSNRNEPWRKFVQTFFLAEQPNGYYVLNDIFRFLKEESVEDDELGAAEESESESAPEGPVLVEPELPVTSLTAPVAPVTAPAAPPPVPEPAPAQEPVREPTPEPEPPLAPAPVEEPLRPQPNGLHHPEPSKEPEPVVEPPAPQEPAREPTPPPAPAPAQVQKPPSPSVATPVPQAAPASTPAQSQQQQQQAPSQPAHPPAPKTWANLAAADSKKWGSAVAQESRGVTVEAAPTQHPPSRSGTTTPVSGSAPAGSRGASGDKNTRPGPNQAQQAAAANSKQVFVKGLVDPMRNEDLENLLSQFGNITNIEFVRNSGCAFVEYEDVKYAQRAITASLNKNQGGGGGVIFKRPDNGENMRVYIETKKERGERPPPRGRGGVPPQNNRGGNFRGRGRGRGIPAAGGNAA